MQFDRCESQCIHEEAVAAVSGKMLSGEEAQSLADTFKTLADPNRVKIIFSLMHQELCVCDLAAVIGASDSAVSHQLRMLRNQKLVKFRREGKILYYSLADEHIDTLLKQGLKHISHSKEWAARFLEFI
ncbi:MAG: helix-turn-helix transcriptional regulator [Syntrophomonadaceae bacterium]|nr:helix-turn-helix transcriptional regulator [Syntrophomonadaceae bacterium]